MDIYGYASEVDTQAGTLLYPAPYILILISPWRASDWSHGSSDSFNWRFILPLRLRWGHPNCWSCLPVVSVPEWELLLINTSCTRKLPQEFRQYMFWVQKCLSEVHESDVLEMIVRPTIRVELQFRRAGSVLAKSAFSRRQVRMAFWMLGDTKRSSTSLAKQVKLMVR